MLDNWVILLIDVCWFKYLLHDPNPNSPANNEAAQLFRENKREYEKRVQQSVQESRMEDESDEEADADKAGTSKWWTFDLNGSNNRNF